jgi:hypothetical protein
VRDGGGVQPAEASGSFQFFRLAPGSPEVAPDMSKFSYIYPYIQYRSISISAQVHLLILH